MDGERASSRRTPKTSANKPKMESDVEGTFEEDPTLTTVLVLIPLFHPEE